MLHIIGPKDPQVYDGIVINCTSHSDDFGKQLSPFFLGPVDLYGGLVAQNVENAWQFSKVYSCHVENNTVTNQYMEWALQGWGDKKAHRYPMGKNLKPLFSLWNGERLSYVEARKKIYIPLYAKAVVKTDAFIRLKKLNDILEDIWLWDFDGYDHRYHEMSYGDVINSTTRKMGHAFVVAMLLEGYINEETNFTN